MLDVAIAPEPLLIFRLGPRRYSLALLGVREVTTCQPLVRLPRASPVLRGAANVRGRVATVVDLGLLLGLPEAGLGAPTERVLILEPRRRDVGLWVSEVLSIGNLRSPDDETAPDAQLVDVEPLGWGDIWRRIEALGGKH
jgi:two-component system, chemotaxis family, chemotaxis protein CheV